MDIRWTFYFGKASRFAHPATRLTGVSPSGRARGDHSIGRDIPAGIYHGRMIPAPSTVRPLARDPRVLIGACYWHGVGGFMFNSSSSWAYDSPQACGGKMAKQMLTLYRTGFFKIAAGHDEWRVGVRSGPTPSQWKPNSPTCHPREAARASPPAHTPRLVVQTNAPWLMGCSEGTTSMRKSIIE